MKNKCEICGRRTNRIYRSWGYTLCSKHMHQYHKYKKFLDNNPRTVNDLNDYVIDGSVAVFNVYNQRCEKISEFMVDLEDIETVKYHKWRLSHHHVVTGCPSKHEQKDLAHVVLNAHPNGLHDFVVDHINGNPMDNRKSNLRICSQSENTLNKSFYSLNTSGFIGVTYIKERNMYDAEIRKGNIRCHLGKTKSLEDAVYKRYVAETLVFGEFANEKEQEKKYIFTKNLSDETKRNLENIVIKKLNAKNLGCKLCRSSEHAA